MRDIDHQWEQIAESCKEEILRLWDKGEDPRKLNWDELYNRWQSDFKAKLSDPEMVVWVVNFLQSLSLIGPETLKAYS